MNQIVTNKDPEKILRNYLEKGNLRKTKERFSILKEIYNLKTHFSVESLHEHLLREHYKISLATVYNTIEHLLACKLIRRHHFEQNLSIYEPAIGQRQHDHLICSDCGYVLEFCDPRIQQIQDTMGELLNFRITGHSLHLYGHCNKLKENGICPHFEKKK
ncbi:MAG: transcriptional repressor [Bacteroidia bacterium]|nr:transcriptional repressor [Bacteroidia bacterium]MCZ2277321.1 transcriptional repressor [Bacteroidia bacterium]